MHNLVSGGSSILANEPDYGQLQLLDEYRSQHTLTPRGGVTRIIHDCEREHCQRIIINIAGQRYETQLKTLMRYPRTLLGDDFKRNSFWDSSRNEYFFDRHRPSFPAILNFYQSGGRLRRPPEVPDDIFYEEIKFFELDTIVIREYLISEGYVVKKMKERVKGTNWASKVWLLLEYPDSSIPAKVLGLFSVLIIVISVVTFCVETIPEFQLQMCVNVTNEYGKWVSKGNHNDPFFLLEACCICWFSFELVMRFLFYPWNRCEFCRSFMNWLDLFAILPFFITLLTFEYLETCSNFKRSNSLAVLRVTRLLRVLRIFKLSKYVSGLRVLGKTLIMSMKELSMFVFFLVISVVLFSTAVYLAELNLRGSHFGSIPDAFWWAVISMTTVGYGDYYPTGFYGKLVGSVCVVAGVLTIALPVPVIVTNFNTVYKQATQRKIRAEVIEEKEQDESAVSLYNNSEHRPSTSSFD